MVLLLLRVCLCFAVRDTSTVSVRPANLILDPNTEELNRQDPHTSAGRSGPVATHATSTRPFGAAHLCTMS